MRHDLGKEFKAGAGAINMGAAAFTPDGKGLALGQGITEAEGKLFLADAATGKKARELGKHDEAITALAIHPAGRHLVSCGRDTLIRFWQLDDGKMVKELGQKRGGQAKDWIHAVAFSADGLWAAAADMAGQINIWSFAG
jgi:WD40 repeat protein